MIIFHENGGRLGNQLLQLIHLYASALEFDIRIYRDGALPDSGIELSLAPHIIHVNELGTWSKIMIRMLVGSGGSKLLRMARKLISRLIRVSRYSDMGIVPGQYVNIVRADARSLKMTDCCIWPYYHFAAVYKWQNVIREHIRFSSEKEAEATQWLDSIAAEGCTLVGVHLRRTDYKEWLGGRYCYPLSLYCKMIRQAANCLPGKIKFIIFSDEKLSAEELSASDLDMAFSHNAFMTDFILMSRCHYLIGPPSTFSGTASFLGKAKKFTIYSAGDNINSESDFGIVGIDYETATSLTITEPGVPKLRGYVRLREGKIISIHTPE